jgi:plasmid maintenance system antidote protein VapI
MKENFPLQSQLFLLIKKKSDNPRNWCTQYQKQFFLSKSAAYKKINGVTPITFDEALDLIRLYNVSFDELLNCQNNQRSGAF